MNPSTGEVQARVPMGDAALLQRAVDAAKAVQPEWAATNPQRRARVMLECRRRLFVLERQGHPTLNSVKANPFAAHLFARALGVSNPASGGHPIDIAGMNGLVGADAVFMDNLPVEQIGDGR